MKKVLLVIFLLVVGAFFINSLSNRLDTTSGEIKAGMKLKSVHEIKIGDAKVQIGQKGKDKMQPKVSFSKGDTKFSLFLPSDSSAKALASAEDNTIRWKEQEQEIYFKKVTEGSLNRKFEFDILLKQKPQSSTFTYNLDTNDLEFVKNQDNSYSAYKKGYLNEKGIYNKGELYRIEKPRVIDSKGKSANVKVELNDNAYSLILDTAFLASASYPVTVDPTIVLNDTNHVVITKIDRFRWKIAVEYEIRDDAGKLLGSDVVIMEANKGETASQFLGFFKDYLTRRNAIWLLAQGNYTLYEMSNDRLTAPHFQKPDNADEIDDQYKDSRQARKQLLDSLKQQDYPTFSLTLEQAEQLQRPNSPTFIIVNEKPGAGTEILRPNGVGYNSGLYPQGDSPGWKCIDEASPDDETTYLWSTSGTSTDGYALGNTALTTETIDSIDVNYRGYKTNFIGSNIHFWAGIRRGGSNTNGTPRNSTSYTNYVETAITRPGGGSWEVGDLDGLEVVVYGEFDTDSIDDETVHVTQAYVTVNYTAAEPTPTPTSTPTPTPTPTPMNTKNFKGNINIRGSVNIK